MDNQKQYSLLMEAFNAVYDNISESHFKVGDEVVCKKSGMEGEVVKLDKPDGKEDEKYYTVKREDGKKVKYAPNELKLAEEVKNGGVPKKKEEKFHTKLDKLVHNTFGSSPEEKKMKEEFNRVEEGYKSPNKERIERQVGKAYKTERSALNRGDADEAMRQNRRRNAMNSPSTRRNELESKNRKEEVEFDIFDVILEHLVAEGYVDTNQAALAIMANMSEEWKQSIVEEVLDEAEGSYGATPKAYGAARQTRMTAKRKPFLKKMLRRTNPANRTDSDDSPRKGMTSDDRERARAGAAHGVGTRQDHDYPSEGPGGVTKNPKKLRKQKAMGEHD